MLQDHCSNQSRSRLLPSLDGKRQDMRHTLPHLLALDQTLFVCEESQIDELQ